MPLRHAGTRDYCFPFLVSRIFWAIVGLAYFCAAQQHPPIVSKAIDHALASSSSGSEQKSNTVDLSTLFKVAQEWDKQKDDKANADAIELFHFLADEHEHVLSMAKLGNHYAERKHISKALDYYTEAGERGPHQTSLYNAGRILVDLQDWVGALAFLKASATLAESHPNYARETTTKVSLEAYELVSSQISRTELEIRQVADIFMYAALDDNLSEDAEIFWRDAVMGLMKFNETFVATSGGHQDAAAMRKAVESMHQIWQKHSTGLSFLQSYLLLDNMNDMLGPLAGLDDSYVPMAAVYAEALASSPYCYDNFAVSEDEPACFNGAAASAMSFFRRAADGDGAERVLQLARSHPEASTKWDKMEQSPRVFHVGLRSKPWWKPGDFSAIRSLEHTFQKNRSKILKELQHVKDLQEGRLQGTLSGSAVEIDSMGGQQSGSITSHDSDQNGLQRIFTPYIGVRTEVEETQKMGAGGWASFGPLFDGVAWSTENCKVVPSICTALKDDPSLCTAGLDGKGNIVNQTAVSRACGADTVVTILRLRPGTTILPHCGTTNTRLILHFPLEGAKGIEFTVGGETVNSYGGGDGHGIVFDDSFEHTVYHGGTQDRYVVLAVLAHPDVLYQR